ncbi:hypothetical protein SLEP1_g17209 [Rubroshorea leprosula]|uniref:Reverse transcriptase n=1 Tax=Rubroshorea leprosula TaxID=152421 RepID=A0AAV5J3Z0_9ROSI|nr:hypothetical protein SLEP1_g17209 [Rubroshorea leprosula]
MKWAWLTPRPVWTVGPSKPGELVPPVLPGRRGKPAGRIAPCWTAPPTHVLLHSSVSILFPTKKKPQGSKLGSRSAFIVSPADRWLAGNSSKQQIDVHPPALTHHQRPSPSCPSEGTVGELDEICFSTEKGQYAKIFIQVDLDQPLVPCVRIRNHVQRVLYEGLVVLGFACGCVGHKENVCPLKVPPALITMDEDADNQPTPIETEANYIVGQGRQLSVTNAESVIFVTGKGLQSRRGMGLANNSNEVDRSYCASKRGGSYSSSFAIGLHTVTPKLSITRHVHHVQSNMELRHGDCGMGILGGTDLPPNHNHTVLHMFLNKISMRGRMKSVHLILMREEVQCSMGACFTQNLLPYSFLEANIESIWTMKVISWNCCGAAKLEFRRTTMDIKKEHNLAIFVLLETKVAGSRAMEIAQGLGMPRCEIMDANGLVGGIWVLWDDMQVTIDILNKGAQVIHAMVKFGGSPVPLFRIRVYTECMDMCNLLDLGFRGPKYTWVDMRENNHIIREWLDSSVFGPDPVVNPIWPSCLIKLIELVHPTEGKEDEAAKGWKGLMTMVVESRCRSVLLLLLSRRSMEEGGSVMFLTFLLLSIFCNVFGLPIATRWVQWAKRAKRLERARRVGVGQMSKRVEDYEIWNTIRSMKPWKAPRPDVLHAMFFQKYWEKVKGKLCGEIRNVFSTGIMLDHWNYSFITLIPKTQNPKLVSQFRPIGLCNVIYKLVTKIIVLRLKPIMGDLISLLQASFILAIPNYYMQGSYLPEATHKELDSLSRQYIWGSTTGKRKANLVSWDRLAQPRSIGGLGIKSSKDANQASMAKAHWRLLIEKEKLWSKAICEKYSIKDPKSKLPKSSSVLDNIAKGKHIIEKGIKWIPKSGQNIFSGKIIGLVINHLKTFFMDHSHRRVRILRWEILFSRMVNGIGEKLLILYQLRLKSVVEPFHSSTSLINKIIFLGVYLLMAWFSLALHIV